MQPKRAKNIQKENPTELKFVCMLNCLFNKKNTWLQAVICGNNGIINKALRGETSL